MKTAYRDQALRCPGCDAWLEPQHVDASTVDVCPACAGLWIDWFDGELGAMAKGAARTAPRSPAERATPAVGGPACPRCQSPLQEERYLETDAEILRCADCAGAFVARASLAALLQVEILAGGPAPKGAMARLVSALRSWLGMG